jgi:phosphoribosyl 1,2-cyclic phosphodiesterase
VILDAGTGLRRLGLAITPAVSEIDVLLSHLHLDHIIGLGFFAPLFQPGVTVRIWAPRATTSLLERLGRYLSPPLFPIRLRDAGSNLELFDVPDGPFNLRELTVRAEPVIHPDPAVGYRVEAGLSSLAYLPDHEPALGPLFPSNPDWTSGAGLASGVDLLVHDAQYTATEYQQRVGWGHSSAEAAVAFADLVGARRLALFHHDPARDDGAIELLRDEAERLSRGVIVIAASEGSTVPVAA